MKNLLISAFLFLFGSQLIGQTTITFNPDDGNNKMYIKLYGHIDYNQKIEKGIRNPGNVDVHRIVTLFGYQFNRNTQFMTEIEFEHADEIFIEQAFIKHRLNSKINLKAGMILVPMGFVNEQHEPTFFYSVERPLLDKNIIPTTWREIGFGISGLLTDQSLKYQLYLFNTVNGYNNGAKFSGATGIRSGRQKGSKEILTGLPALSGQLEYYGFENGKVGLSFYKGKTNTSLVKDYPQITPESQAIIDSSMINMTMLSLHASFSPGKLDTRFQYTHSFFGNSSNYNDFASSDLPEQMMGYYLTIAYNLLNSNNQKLSPFIRYSRLNNHFVTGENTQKNLALNQNITTLGINYFPNPGVVFKVDYQFYNKDDNSSFQQFNTGVGVWF